jgi:hypothetical protein
MKKVRNQYPVDNLRLFIAYQKLKMNPNIRYNFLFNKSFNTKQHWISSAGTRIPGPNFLHPGSRIRIKKFKYFNPKKWFLSSRKYDPGCSSRILNFLPIRIQGSKRHQIPDPNPQHCLQE